MLFELTDSEEIFYNRQIRLEWIGKEGQILLKSAKILVIGAGGLGCPVLLHLAAAGLGKITIVDPDKVQIHNLHRQTLYTIDDVGKSKVLAAKTRLQKSYPTIEIDALETSFTIQNAVELIQNQDLVIDCTDNFTSRYLINDACFFENKPFVSGAVENNQGQVALFNTSKEATNYRDLFPKPPEWVQDCNELGVVGTLTGITGLLQAQLVLHFFLKLKPSFANKLILLDLFELKTRVLQILPNPENPLSGANPSIQTLINEEVYCQAHQLQLNNSQLELPLSSNYILIDLRENWDSEQQPIPNSYNIPFGIVADFNFAQFEKKKILLICDIGNKSLTSAKFLQAKFPEKLFFSLNGGIESLKIIDYIKT